MTSLRRLQRWFAHCVVHPDGAAAALAGRTGRALVPRAHVDAGRVLARDARRDAAAMLQVHNGGYVARLYEVLQRDFGAVLHTLGAATFHAVVARYVHEHPSRHPNLNRLGESFPAFLAGRRSLRHRAFVAELARLERALAVAFDAPESRPLAAGALAAIAPSRWPRLRFTLDPSVHVLAFRHPVDRFYQAWRDDRAARVPRVAPSWLVVFRRDDQVFRRRLERPAHRVLAALAAGERLGDALALARPGEPVQRWFESFARDGLFTAIRG